MTDNSFPELGIDRDDMINQAFEDLVHDELEGFLLVTLIDGDLQGVSLSPRYENPEEFVGDEMCELPLMNLLGGCIAEVALEYGLPPEDVADVGLHVTVDHLGVDSETTDETWQEVFELANIDIDTDKDLSSEEIEQALEQIKELTKSSKE